MTDHYTPEQLEEVSSWIHNEQRCVTTQTISLDMGLPRSVAAMMLNEMPKKDRKSYECTKFVLTSKDDGTTVIQLRKSVVSANDMDVDDATTAPSSIYSLALVETESVHTAHEKDMATFRDKLKEEEDNAAPTLALDGSLHQHDIASCFSTGRVTARASQEQRLAGRVAAATAQHAAAPAAPVATKKAARKATTAANFFAATGKKKAATTSKATAKPAASKKKSSSTTKTAPSAKATKSDAKMDVDEEEHSDASTVEFSQEEKENSLNKKIGNADDFVGDEDEDEEFEEEERKRAQRQKTAAKKKKAAAKPKPVEVVEKEPVHGAMDAFAQPQEKAPQKHHKRRKKLVDKTTMDANGYLHTETQAVWEDVSSGEEDEKPAPKPKKAPVKSTKNMKQGSLMGFFKKK